MRDVPYLAQCPFKVVDSTGRLLAYIGDTVSSVGVGAGNTASNLRTLAKSLA